MRRHISLAAFTVVAAFAVAVAAQAQERDSMRVTVRRTPDRTFVYSFGPEDMMVMRRGRLGITVDLRPDAARDTVGALVSGVTPGGPADRAGIRSGDLITRLNGTRLAATDGGSDDDREQSRPGLRLINLASRLEQGDTVRLDVQRDGRPQTMTFTAAETDMDQIVERMRRLPGGQTFMREFGEGPSYPRMPGDMPRIRVMTSLDGLGDLELIRVTLELAQALNLSEGVLVADAGRDSSLGLRTGDVITAIGGRRPTSPSHAMRILSSYESGEAVQFDVMRRGRRVAVSGRMPASREPTWRVRPNRFDNMEPGMEAPFRFKVSAEGGV